MSPAKDRTQNQIPVHYTYHLATVTLLVPCGTEIKITINKRVFFRYKHTYCESCILYHDIKKNIYKELPPCDTSGATAMTSGIELSW